MALARFAFQACSFSKGSGSGDRCTTDVPKPPHINVTAVRSTKWVGDFSRLESTIWSWWTTFSPVGTAWRVGWALSTALGRPA